MGMNKLRVIRDIKPVAIPGKICAILPFFKENGDDFELSIVGRAYGFCLSLILVVTAIAACLDVLFHARFYKIMQNSQGNTEEINQTIETLFCIISYTMMVTSSVFSGPKHCRTLKDIAKVDEYLEANGFDGCYKCPLLMLMFGFLSGGLMFVSFYYIHFQSELAWLSEFVLLASFALQITVANVFAIYLRITLKNVTLRIAFVNEKLETFTKDKTKDNWRELSNLIEILCKFRYIIESINSVMGVALLFYMGFAFYTVTNQSYLAFSTLTTHVLFRKKYDTMGLSVSWVLAEIVIMVVICGACDEMSSEANTTSQILARVYGKSKEYQNIIDKFLTKTIKQEVEFTAYGFFVVDNSTLFKIFSAVTTYLVILIQFKQLEDSKMEDQLAAQGAYA